MLNKFLFLAIIIILIYSCGTGTGYEDYNFNSVENIILTRNNHPHGYGKKECFYCHVNRRIHRVDRLNSGQLENARYLTSKVGISSCYQCHGTNGVVE